MGERRRNGSESQPSAFSALATERDGIVVVSVTGELDMLTVAQAASVFEDAATRGLPMVVDLTGLTFFSSAGLTLLVRLGEQDPRLDVRLVADDRVVLLPLELAGLRDLFPVHSSLHDALAATP